MGTRNVKQDPMQTRHAAARSHGKTQTTLRLPRKLYEKAKRMIESREGGSFNDFIVTALAAYVRALERKAIDESFKGMANDRDYQRETRRIMKEFSASDAETIALTERDLAGA